MFIVTDPLQWFFGAILLLASLGVITTRTPVYASLSFLLAVLSMSALFFQLQAEVIGMMQLLVYGGATMVVFMFIIVLFQDAHKHINDFLPQSYPLLLCSACVAFVAMVFVLCNALKGLVQHEREIADGFGYAKPLGEELYTKYFFPFEAVSLIFLVALIGALYIAKKSNEEAA